RKRPRIPSGLADRLAPPVVSVPVAEAPAGGASNTVPPDCAADEWPPARGIVRGRKSRCFAPKAGRVSSSRALRARLHRFARLDMVHSSSKDQLAAVVLGEFDAFL